VRDPNQFAPPVALFHLTVDQPRCYLPLAPFAPSANHLDPLTKVGCERIKVEIETVTGKERQAARRQDLSQGVDHPMSHVLGAGTELKHGKKLGARVESQPEPEHLCSAAEPGTQFVQLEVREVEMEEEALVQRVRVYIWTSEKGW